MKVILATMGSPGDLFPCGYLGAYLKNKNHEVHVIAGSGFRGLMEGFGLHFHDIANTEKNKTTVNDPGFARPESHMALVRDLFIDAIDPILELVKEQYEPGNTVLMAPTRILGARLAQELYDIPLVSYQLQPSFMDSFDACSEAAAEKELAEPLARVRENLGLAPLDRSVVRWSFSPDRVLGFYPEWFCNRPSLHTPYMEQLGFLQGAGSVLPLTPEIQAFLDAGEAPVIFSSGTTPLRTKAHYARMVQICEELGIRAIFAPCDAAKLDVKPPPSVLCLPWAHFQSLMPLTRAVVHPGGIGATAEALRAGVPQILLGYALDQPDNGTCIEQIGVGKGLFEIAYDEDNDLKDSVLVAALQEVLNNPSYSKRSRELGSKLTNPLAVCARTEEILLEVLQKQEAMQTVGS